MNGLTLLALLAPAAAFQLASPAHFRPRAAIRMQEEEAAPVEEAAAVPESSGPLDRTSPLAGVVGETNLKSFEEKKAEDNAKRLALRERINIGLPAAFFLSLGIASFIGEDKVKAALKGDGSGDPFGNAPGVAEARAKKKEREAKVRCLHDWRCAAAFFIYFALNSAHIARLSLSLSLTGQGRAGRVCGGPAEGYSRRGGGRGDEGARRLEERRLERRSLTHIASRYLFTSHNKNHARARCRRSWLLASVA